MQCNDDCTYGSLRAGPLVAKQCWYIPDKSDHSFPWRLVAIIGGSAGGALLVLGCCGYCRWRARKDAEEAENRRLLNLSRKQRSVSTSSSASAASVMRASNKPPRHSSSGYGALEDD